MVTPSKIGTLVHKTFNNGRVGWLEKINENENEHRCTIGDNPNHTRWQGPVAGRQGRV